MTAPEEPDSPPKKLGLKRAEFESVNEPTAPGAPSGNDALDMLRINRQHEKARGLDDIPVGPKKKSRRNREYLAILVTVDGVLGWMLFHAGEPFSFVFLLAGMILFSAGLTWIMLFIFEDY